MSLLIAGSNRVKLNGGSGDSPLNIANITGSNQSISVGIDNAGGAFFRSNTGVVNFAFQNANGRVRPHTMDVSAASSAVANLFKGYNASDIPVRVEIAAAQTGDAFQVFASDGVTKLFAVNAAGQPIIATKTPSSAADSGQAGQLAWDSNYIYICIATNTWKRVAVATW